MELIKVIALICLFLLLGTGVQWVVCAMANCFIQFSTFSFWQWVFQIIWWILLICCAILVYEDEC